MLRYVSRAELVEIAQEPLTEAASIVSKAEGRSPTGATFLSYSSKDRDAVPAVVRILENHGATIYLDKKDPTLPGKTPQSVASALRERIGACKKLVVFATNNSAGSKWVPWELGLGDGTKGRRNVCIFPGPDKANDKEWLEQEYLGVYDRAIWGNFSGQDQRGWLVWNYQTNLAIRLSDWLSV
jgi:hypothetical protein